MDEFKKENPLLPPMPDDRVALGSSDGTGASEEVMLLDRKEKLLVSFPLLEALSATVELIKLNPLIVGSGAATAYDVSLPSSRTGDGMPPFPLSFRKENALPPPAVPPREPLLLFSSIFDASLDDLTDKPLNMIFQLLKMLCVQDVLIPTDSNASQMLFTKDPDNRS